MHTPAAREATPSSTEGSELVDAYQQVLEREAAKRDHEPDEATASGPVGQAGKAAVAVLLTCVSVWFWVAPPAWVRPPSEPLPTAEAQAQGRDLELVVAAAQVEAYRQANGALPPVVDGFAPADRAIDYTTRPDGTLELRMGARHVSQDSLVKVLQRLQPTGGTP